MKALILAGGRGTRLQPYTTTIPKPLMPVGSHAILEILLHQLKSAGIDEVVLAVGYLSHLLRAYLGDGKRLGMHLEYVDEESPLGTAGPIGSAFSLLGDRFLLMNGDLLTTLDFARLLEFHDRSAAAVTIGTYRREIAIDFGVLKVSEHGRLLEYDEKPVLNYRVSMGVYVIEKLAVHRHVLPVHRIDAPDLIRLILADGNEVACFEDKCYWLDIGRPEDYRLANELVMEGRFKLPAMQP